jgi:hypothetical protein
MTEKEQPKPSKELQELFIAVSQGKEQVEEPITRLQITDIPFSPIERKRTIPAKLAKKRRLREKAAKRSRRKNRS